MREAFTRTANSTRCEVSGANRSCKKRYYQFTTIDDCTRLRIYEHNNQVNAIRFIDYTLFRLPFLEEVIRTDHGSEFRSQFHCHVLDKGIRHAYI